MVVEDDRKARLLAQLMELVEECPACSPADFDDYPEDELEKWIRAHGGEPSEAERG